ncbi:AtpZ/AtpI family protein [Candidatus Saccharibacteria bacterium]|nr:AtpZ/AtpI family protein [Candidatus Saccharibacteria bacterium]
MAKGVRKKQLGSADDEIGRYAAMMSAKQQFVSAAFDMGWRLALTVLVPVFIGAWLDRRYNTAPTWALTALFLSIGAAGLVVSATLKNLNKTRSSRGDK